MNKCNVKIIVTIGSPVLVMEFPGHSIAQIAWKIGDRLTNTGNEERYQFTSAMLYSVGLNMTPSGASRPVQ